MTPEMIPDSEMTCQYLRSYQVIYDSHLPALRSRIPLTIHPPTNQQVLLSCLPVAKGGS